MSWTGANNNGLWTDPLNWTGGTGVPTAADDVTIGSGFPAISISGGRIHSLSSASPLQMPSGSTLVVITTVNLSADLTINGGSLQQATVTTSDGAKLLFASGGGSLDLVTLNGNLVVDQNNVNVTVVGSLVLNGTAYLGSGDGVTYGQLNFVSYSSSQYDVPPSLRGNGTVLLGANAYNGVFGAEATLTIGAGITIRGDNGVISSSYPATVVNEGTINADTAGGTIAVGSLGTGGPVYNTGVMKATAGALKLGGIFTMASLGTVQSAGGSVNITGELTDGLTLNASTGSWTLLGGTIFGGPISESGGAKLLFTASGGVLEVTTFNGDLDLGRQGNALVTISGSLVLNGTAYLGSPDGNSYGRLLFGDQYHPSGTLGGSATILFGASPSNALLNDSNFTGANGTLTIGPDITIRGGSGSISYYYNNTGSVVYQGTINADSAGGTITVGSLFNTFSNAGVMEATGGTLHLMGNWSNAGTIAVTNSTINLGGNFTQAGLGTFFRTGGTVELSGILSGGLTLDASTGSWILLNGTLSDGTINQTAGAKLLSSFLGGYFASVTFNGDLDLSQPSGASVTIKGISGINGTVYLGSADGSTYGRLFVGSYGVAAGMLWGNGTVLFGPNSLNALANGSNLSGTAGTMYIGPDITVRGSGGGIYNTYSTATIINQGTINADTSGGTITVGTSTGTFSNTGVIEATAGTLKVQKASNLLGGVITGGTWEAFYDGKLALPFSISLVDAHVVLDGPGSMITDSSGTKGAFANLAVINSGGSLALRDGQSLSVTAGGTGGTLFNDGSISLSAGSQLLVTGAYTQMANKTLAVQISGPTSFGQLVATGTATVGGALQATLGAGYDPAAGQTFAVVTGSSITGSFSSFSGGTTPGGLPLLLNYSTTSATISINPLPLSCLGTQIDDGNRQRSLVRSLTFSFSSPVTLAAGAITLARLNTGGSGTNDGSTPTDASAALGTPTTSDGGLTWVVPIVTTSAFSSFGSLTDGIYTATVHAALATDAFNQHLSGGDQTKTFHRLFGDLNGDQRVNAVDYGMFTAAFGSTSTKANYVVYFDLNHDGRINAIDYGLFAADFGKSFVYTPN
ncbi:MAG TPA: dockerin type I domain-containing protein [Tepidisphaeraceae bacterium]|nr:dockerin type I domain-containing protein [Tepidisphaeraceae bacterium]